MSNDEYPIGNIYLNDTHYKHFGHYEGFSKHEQNVNALRFFNAMNCYFVKLYNCR